MFKYIVLKLFLECGCTIERVHFHCGHRPPKGLAINNEPGMSAECKGIANNAAPLRVTELAGLRVKGALGRSSQ